MCRCCSQLSDMCGRNFNICNVCSKFGEILQPLLWSRGNIVVFRLAGPGSIPSWASFPGWGFSSIVRQMSGKFSSHPSLDIIGHHNHQKSFITGANDLWCWLTLKFHIWSVSTNKVSNFIFSHRKHVYWQWMLHWWKGWTFSYFST